MLAWPAQNETKKVGRLFSWPKTYKTLYDQHNTLAVINFSKKNTIPIVFKHNHGTLINTPRFNQWTKILSTAVQVVKFLKLIT